MKIATKLRLFGGVVLLFNIWMIGRYKLESFVVFLLTLGFAAGYEYFVVRSVLRVENLSGIALGSPTPKVADPISASQTVNDEMWKQALEEYESKPVAQDFGLDYLLRFKETRLSLRRITWHTVLKSCMRNLSLP